MKAGKIKIGINGFGRAGRSVARVALQRDDIEVVAINDPQLTVKDMVYIFRNDGYKWQDDCDAVSNDDDDDDDGDGGISLKDNALLLGGKHVTVYAHLKAEEIPWAKAGAEYVVESTGNFTDKDKAAAHLKGGAKKVIITSCSEDAPVFIMGVNEQEYRPELDIISTADRTTNCVAPLAKVIQDRFGIVKMLMTRFDSVVIQTADRPLNMEWRRPETTISSISGAAKAIGKVLPALYGKVNEKAFPGWIVDASCVILTVKLEMVASYNQIMDAIKEESEGKLKGILHYLEEDVVSTEDFIWDRSLRVVDLIAHMAKTD